MISKVYSATVQGISPVLVEVEVSSILAETFSIAIVGLPDAAVREARELRPALRSSALQEPLGLVTVNLARRISGRKAPASIWQLRLPPLRPPIKSARPIWMTISSQGNWPSTEPCAPSTEPSPWLCARADQARKASSCLRKMRWRAPWFPASRSTRWNLWLNWWLLRGETILEPMKESFRISLNGRPETTLDFADVKGQESVKRALEIAAAGAHNLIMVGPPGTGKSMLARRLPSILPPMTLEEALEVTQIHSIMGLLKPGQHILTERPFRAPHHTASNVGLLGGGSTPTPGEITLAHHGVLFLDELPEFKRTALETLRQPLEDGFVTISRASGTLVFPSELMLIAAMNPSPDGKMPQESRSSPRQIQCYLGRISGPLLDRIDLHIEVPTVPFRYISSNQEPAESSAEIRKRVIAARQRQIERFKQSPNIRSNARMGSRELKNFCNLNADCLNLLKMAMSELHLSARAYDRIRKVARTIADLDNSDEIQTHHIMEASQYRNLDRQVWSFISEHPAAEAKMKTRLFALFLLAASLHSAGSRTLPNSGSG